MEGVQKLPMISFDLKTSPENTDFGTKIKHIIRNSFGEDPETFSNEIRELESLRANSCIRISESIDGVATLKKYYCQLNFLKSRFKIGSDGPFQFSWRDIYGGSEYSYTEFSFELAAVLYNIGALHTRLGCQEERGDSDGMKMAVAHFQCAAWAFHSLPDLHSQALDSDFNSELLTFEAQIALAQAQECILEKSILDGRKPSIIAKVCGQVVVYYSQALRTLETSNGRPDLAGMGSSDRIADVVGNKQSKMWKAFVEFKIPYYQCVAWLHMGMNSEETQRMGERVTYYQAAHDCLTQSAKLAKKLDGPFKNVTESLIFTDDVTKGKLEISKKENEFIYHEKVPDLANMQEIKGASLVKGIAFDMNDPDVSGPDLFKRLVSLEAHESSSLYSEEKAKLLRNICGDIEMADSELAVYMSSVQIQDIPGPADHISLPQELIECAAGLSVRPSAVNQLGEAMAKLASVSAEVEASLREIQGLLKEEEGKEDEYQEAIGKRPKSLVTDLERETQKYHEAHSMASESNLTLHKAMQLHIKNLKLLSRPLTEIQAKIPSLDDLDSDAETTIVEVRRILDKVEEMRSQRSKLEEDLRRDLLEDDITGSLAVKGEGADVQQVFEEQLKKHDKTVATIRQNLVAQSNILSAFTESNARFADTRKKVTSVVRRREDTIGSLVASYHAYEDLLTKTTKGLEFYDKLEVNVSKLLARVGGVVKVQEEDRQANMVETEKKAAEARALSLSLLSGGMGPMPSLGFTPMSEFTPGAPPLDTPDQLHGGYQPPPVSQGGYQPPQVSQGGYQPPQVSQGGYRPPPAVSQPSSSVPSKPSTGRPTLGDYLKARKESGLEMPGKTSTADKEKAPGVRPQPLGSESEPPYSVHSIPGYSHPGYNYPGYPYQPGKAGPVSQPTTGQAYPQPQAGQNYSQPLTGQAYPQPPAGQNYPQPQAGQNYKQQPTGQAYPQPPAGQNYPQPQAGENCKQTPTGQAYPQPQTGQVYPQPTAGQAYPQPTAGQAYPQPQAGQTYPQPQGGQTYPQSTAGQKYPQPPAGQNYKQPSAGQSYQQSGQVQQPSQITQQPEKQPNPSTEHPYQQQTNQYPPTGHPYSQPQTAQAYQQPIRQQPTSQTYQQPTSQPSVSQAYQPPVSQTYQLPQTQLSGGYQPPKTQPSVGQTYPSHPITGQTYPPGASGLTPAYQPPGGQQPSSTPAQVPSQSYQQVYSRHILPPYSPAQAGPTVPSLVRPPVPSFANLQGNHPGATTAISSQSQIPGRPVVSQQQNNWGQSPIAVHQGAPYQPQGQYPSASQPQQGGQRFQTPTSNSQQMSQSKIPPHNPQQFQPQTQIPPSNPQQFQTPPSNTQQFQTPLSNPQQFQQPSQTPLSNPQQFQQPSQTPLSNPQQFQQPLSHPQPTVSQPGGNLHQQATISKPSDPLSSSNLDLLAGLDISGPGLSGLPIQSAYTIAPETPPSKPVVPMPGSIPKLIPVPAAAKPVVEAPEPLVTDEERLHRLTVEAEKLQSLVSSLTSRTLSGPTPLESKWKEMLELLEALPGKRSVSVARCYPHKNRVPDVLPFDQTRLELKQKDDYINASHVRDLSSRCPSLIVTQAPSQATMVDFWTGIWQEQVETIMCLVPDSDLGSNLYIPKDQKSPLTWSDFNVSLQSSKTSASHIERVINICHLGSKQTRALVHVQMLGWPGPDLPASPAPIIDSALSLLSLHKQQRVSSHPVLVHCTDGGTKSGTFAAVLSLLSEMESSSGPAIPSSPGFPDVTHLFGCILGQRKGIVRDKIYMNLVYEILLYYIQDSLMKQGILTRQTSHSKSHNRHPSQDFILGPKLNNQPHNKSNSDVAGSVGDNNEEQTAIANENDEISNGSKCVEMSAGDAVEEPSTDAAAGESTGGEISNGSSLTSAKPSLDMSSGFPDDLSKLVDFSLTDSPAKKKITKEDFMKPSPGITGGQDASDPLSQLDPLWSLK